MESKVYLIPTVLADGTNEVLPSYVLTTVKSCQVFFVEQERTARRYLKSLWKEMVIDDYEWFSMKEGNNEVATKFRQKIKEKKIIGIISEAGCPGVADPGQQLVAIAHLENIPVSPLVGPSAILLALMASGMNGQQFRFEGYLPIEAGQRIKVIKELENESRQKNCTQIFIETPYRNIQLLETLTKTCLPETKICIACDITAPTETIRTQTAQQWKKEMPQLHKRPAIFLLYSGI